MESHIIQPFIKIQHGGSRLSFPMNFPVFVFGSYRLLPLVDIPHRGSQETCLLRKCRRSANCLHNFHVKRYSCFVKAYQLMIDFMIKDSCHIFAFQRKCVFNSSSYYVMMLVVLYQADPSKPFNRHFIHDPLLLQRICSCKFRFVGNYEMVLIFK